MTEVKFIDGGPAIVTSDGLISVNVPDSVPVTQGDAKYVAICRCGKSSNGLFCDGSHVNKKKENE